MGGSAAHVARVELSADHIELLSDLATLPAGVRIFTSVPSTAEPPCFEAPVLQSVVDAALLGCLEHTSPASHDFCKEWVDTTDGW